MQSNFELWPKGNDGYGNGSADDDDNNTENNHNNKQTNEILEIFRYTKRNEKKKNADDDSYTQSDERTN